MDAAFVIRHSNTSFSRMDAQRLIQATFQPEKEQAAYRVPILYVQLMSGFRVEIDSVLITSSWQMRHAKKEFSRT